jgi:hypothetical protein
MLLVIGLGPKFHVFFVLKLSIEHFALLAVVFFSLAGCFSFIYLFIYEMETHDALKVANRLVVSTLARLVFLGSL